MQYETLDHVISFRITDSQMLQLVTLANSNSKRNNDQARDLFLAQLDEAYQQLLADGHIPAEKEPQA